MSTNVANRETIAKPSPGEGARPRAHASLLSGRGLMIVLARFLPGRLVLRRREAMALRDAIDARIEEMPETAEGGGNNQAEGRP